MSNITLSAGVRQNLLALQNEASLFNITSQHLSTGKKVNSALDNPTAYFTAAGLNTRASELSDLLDSMGNAVQTVQAFTREPMERKRFGDAVEVSFLVAILRTRARACSDGGWA